MAEIPNMPGKKIKMPVLFVLAKQNDLEMTERVGHAMHTIRKASFALGTMQRVSPKRS